MKKVITLMSVLVLVFGFAGMAAAEELAPCVDCTTAPCDECHNPGFINRGCDKAAQGEDCPLFDYNDTTGRIDENGELISGNSDASYCDAKGELHRAMIDICDCDESFWGALEVDDTIDITMEILVDSGSGMESGNNGVYWAEEVGSAGINMTTHDCGFPPVTGIMCNPPLPYPAPPQSVPSQDFAGEQKFKGPYIYVTGTGSSYDQASRTFSASCAVPSSQRYTVIKPDPAGDTGYVLTDPDLDGKCVWGFDIPAMRADYDQILGGEDVIVKVSLSGGASLCQGSGCVCYIYIGKMCCPTEGDYELLFPYATPMDDQDGWWFGMSITNPTDKAGSFTVTFYESDGDVYESDSIPIAANTVDTYINKDDVMTSMSLYHLLAVKTETDGDKGDERGFIKVSTDFKGAGFMAIGNLGLVQSFTYLAE